MFIQAKNLHYSFDFCPAFRDWLDAANAKHTAFSVEKVHDELLAGDDQLSVWARDRGTAFFLLPDSAILPSLAALSGWASGASYDPAAVNTFLQVADYYLIAYAHAHELIVVSHEVASDSRKKIKIPNACIAVGVKVMSPYEMLRTEKARIPPIWPGKLGSASPR